MPSEAYWDAANVEECWYCGYENACLPDKWNGRPACQECWDQVERETRFVDYDDFAEPYKPGEIYGYMTSAFAYEKALREVSAAEEDLKKGDSILFGSDEEFLGWLDLPDDIKLPTQYEVENYGRSAFDSGTEV